MRFEVVRDPEDRERAGWRLIVNGEMTTPSFNSKGAALAYRDLIKRGVRQPEFAVRRNNGQR